MKLNQTKKCSVFLTITLMLIATLSVSVFSAQVTAQTTTSVTINNGATYTNSTSITLTLSSTNATQMRFSTDNSSWSEWETYSTSKNYTLAEDNVSYTVYVEFKNSDNQTSTANSSIILDTTPPEVYSYAAWYSTDYRTVYFDASYCTDNYGIANYTWNFGDGNTTTGVIVIHTYEEMGNYTVTLSVQDLAGNIATNSFNAKIPDLTTVATATPTPTYTAPPTTTPTAQPTASPTSTATDNSTWIVVMLGAVVAAIAVVGVVIILTLKKSSKPVPSAP
ncbi:MAG: PKD domain-containing protein [Candidatus Bathyarchaeota archaeon]|nr:PKD domain-containing protein [Candidatus Bathyarchaeota archaeon]